MDPSKENNGRNRDDNNNNGPETKVFKYKCSFSATVNDTMKRRGWVEVGENCDDWDIFWCDMNQMRDIFTSPTRVLDDHQRIGHFRNCFEISRKNLMVKNLRRLRSRIEKAFGKEEGEKCNFFPTTFILPHEHKTFMMAYRESPDSLWIIKPAAGAQGRGIFIFQKLRDYFDWRGRFDTPEHQLLLQQQQNQILEQHILEKLRLPIEPANQSHYIRRPEASRRNMTPDDLAALDANELGLPIPAPTAGGSAENLQEKDSATVANPAEPPDPATIRAAEANKNDIFVVQQYIKNPYLIGGRKFDIRLYVLVSSYMPLKVWVYREGFARFSAGQFSLKSLQDVYVHLTNVAIQRTSEDYNPEKGSKWSLGSLREYMTARHGRKDVQELMNQIDNIIIRTLQSVHQLVSQDSHCFEVYGFDVLIDSNVRPWLLEVNASPAFTPSNEEDYRLKCALIDDTVHVLDLEGRLTGFEKRVGGYDLIWSDGPVYANPNDCGHLSGENGPKLNSFLGCLNDRGRQLRTIFANAKFIREAHLLQTGPAKSGNAEIPLDRIQKPEPVAEDERFRLPAVPGPTSDTTAGPSSGRPQTSGPRASHTGLPMSGPKGHLRGPSTSGEPKTLRVAGKAISLKKNMASFLRNLENNNRF